MYPDLSYMFNDLFGTPVDNAFSVVQTFGLFLSLAVTTSGIVLYQEFKRYEKNGIFKGIERKETIGQGPHIGSIVTNAALGFLVGYKLLYILLNSKEFVLDPPGFIFSAKGHLAGGLVGLIALAAWKWYDMYSSKLENPEIVTKIIMPHQLVPDITIIAAISGIIGSRLFSILENFGDFLDDPIGQLISGSGLTIYGGLILAFIVVYIYVKRIPIRPIHVMDAVAPALIIGYAVGRLGCQFAGDGDWGIVNNMPKPSWFIFPEWAWAYDYPHNVINSMNTDPITGNSFYNGMHIEDCGGIIGVDGQTPEHCTKLKEMVFPTPLYEFVFATIIFIVLWLLRKRLQIIGLLFFIYLILNGIERFFIEGIRVNEHYTILGVNWSLSQFIAALLFLGGVIGAIYLLKFGKKFGNDTED